MFLRRRRGGLSCRRGAPPRSRAAIASPSSGRSGQASSRPSGSDATATTASHRERARGVAPSRNQARHDNGEERKTYELHCPNRRNRAHPASPTVRRRAREPPGGTKTSPRAAPRSGAQTVPRGVPAEHLVRRGASRVTYVVDTARLLGTSTSTSTSRYSHQATTASSSTKRTRVHRRRRRSRLPETQPGRNCGQRLEQYQSDLAWLAASKQAKAELKLEREEKARATFRAEQPSRRHARRPRRPRA